METYSTPPGAVENLRVGRAAAIQSGSTLAFGKVLTVSGKRWQLEVDIALEIGTRVEVRVELTPISGTALARGRVSHALPVADGEPARYFVEISEIAAEDRERCANWLDSVRTGGTLSTFSAVSDVRGIGGGRASVRDVLRNRDDLRGGVTVLE